MERNYRVYRYQNLVVPTANYIGKTCYKYQSMRTGKNGSQYIRGCPKFGTAIIEYGWPNFEYSVLADNLTEEEADELEKYYIEYFDSVNQGYNDSIGGKNGTLGVHRSDGFRKNLSDSNKNNPKYNPKSVQRFTKDGRFVAEYFSIYEASRQTGIYHSNISACCHERKKSAGGSIWKFA